MVAEVVTPRTPFFHSDLPIFMDALANPRLFHTDRHGDHLYELKPEGRYEFAESVQKMLYQKQTHSMVGISLFFSCTAW